MSTQMPRLCTFIAVLGSVALLNSGSHVRAAAAVECTVLSLQQKAPAGTTITAATSVEAADGVPQYCRVDGFVETAGNTVNFRLGLPAAWNGKFYFQGVGGFAGSIGSLDNGLRRGYASASTDTGHQGSATDARWALNNRPKEIDYAHRGAHVTTVAAKSLIESYYGAPPGYAYFNGCSNGGRQALMEAQRYPEDFDGIIAGDPSFGMLGYIQRVLGYQALLSSFDRFLPAAKLALISNTVLAACDATDGLEDGLITDPRSCTFRPETLKCPGPDGPNCLTAGQLDTLTRFYADTRLASPDQVIYGFPVGHEAGSTGWQSWITGTADPIRRPDGMLEFGPNPPTGFRFMEGYSRYLAFDIDDPHYDWRTFSLERDSSRLEVMLHVLSPTDPDLTKLKQRGGKLILYHGWADPAISAYGTLAYYEKVARAVGGQQQADEFVKLFLAPGMHHCTGGPGPNTFDIVTALENWVERGVAPARVIASHATNGVVDRTRPLCPHPQVARYVGTGSIDAAENFRCATPPAERARR